MNPSQEFAKEYAWWQNHLDEPRCDECNVHMEEADEWCGECGNCREHCAQYEGCRPKVQPWPVTFDVKLFPTARGRQWRVALTYSTNAPSSHIELVVALDDDGLTLDIVDMNNGTIETAKFPTFEDLITSLRGLT